jgi:hypothetical protein
VIQQIESNVLIPRIMGHTVGVSPLTVLLGILIGAILYGLPGAFLAVPIAGAFQVILAHWLGMEDMVQSTTHSPAVAREAVAEAAAGAAARAAPGEAPVEAAKAAAEAEGAPPANRVARPTTPDEREALRGRDGHGTPTSAEDAPAPATATATGG